MFSSPIILLGLLLIVVITVLRRAGCRHRSARRFSVEWRDSIGHTDAAQAPGVDADGGACPFQNCRHVNRPSARYCGRCGRPLTVHRAA
jgi:hypothetical protein